MYENRSGGAKRISEFRGDSMNCKNCGSEIEWCEVCKQWEHIHGKYLYSLRLCPTETCAEPEVIDNLR